MIKLGKTYYRLDVPKDLFDFGTPDDSLPPSRFFDEVFVEGKSFWRWGRFGWEVLSPFQYEQIFRDAGFPSIDLPWGDLYQAPWGAVYVVSGEEAVVTPFNSFKAYMAACMGAKL